MRLLTHHPSFRTVICMLFLTHSSMAQVFPNRVFTSKDGLPSSYVFGCSQDSSGYLWVGTSEGVSRFDGKSFMTYGVADGLPDNRVPGGFVDSRHRYWAATARGPAEFRGNHFFSYPFSDSMNVRWVAGLFEPTPGTLWALTDVGAYQLNNNKWDKLSLYPGNDNHHFFGVVKDKEGLFINYGDLIVLKRPDNTYQIIAPKKKEGYYYYSLLQSGEDLFVSTMDGLMALKDHQLVRMPGILGKFKGLVTYFRDSRKRFWVSRFQSGIHLFEPGDTDHFLEVMPPSRNFLPQSFQEDSQGNIWISTGSGLFRITELGYKIMNLPTSYGDGTIRNIMQPLTGPLLVNTSTLTMQTFDQDTFHHYTLHRTGKPASEKDELIIDNYTFDDKNRPWYITRQLELFVQEGHSLRNKMDLIIKWNDQAFDVLFDKYRKKVLVAVRGHPRPVELSDNSSRLMETVNELPVKGTINMLNQCSNGIILYSTDQGVVYSIDRDNKCKVQFQEFANNTVISAMHNDPSGDVWIIYSGRGLRRYSWQKDSLVFQEQLMKSTVLPSDNVSGISFDNYNNLWVATNSNVTVLSKRPVAGRQPTYQVIRTFDSEDLQLKLGVDTRIRKDIHGNIWYFSGSNLICFYPDKISFNATTPSITIENLQLNLQQTDWSSYSDSLYGMFQLPHQLSLSHKNNTLGIYFKGISTAGTEDVRYTYLLENLGSNWSEPSPNNFVSFVNLPPGEYNFQVKARLPGTDWSKPTSFSFEIRKAFWQTWWFIALTAILVCLAIYTLFRYRLTQKLRIFEMRNRISQDLHDEIGSSMSGINLFSQLATDKLENDKPAEASEYLLKVKNYSQDVIEKLSDMVWIFNPQNDSIEKLLIRLKSFALSIAVSKNIKLHFTTDKASETLNLSIRQRKAIYLISKEAINNAFKYAQCQNLHYSLTGSAGKWRLQIHDDGVGFLPDEQLAGNGLKNMKARADEIGAGFSIQSGHGQGTTILIES